MHFEKAFSIVMHAAKHTLRKAMKKRLMLLNEAEKVKQSNNVIQQLFNHPKYVGSKRISIFLSMDDEVRTESILDHAFVNCKTVFIPKYVSDVMDMVRLDSKEEYDGLPETKWHIKQPADDDNSRDNALDGGGLDLILMPGLGFTMEGERLGRGKGYYDTYIKRLHDLNNRPYLLALAYSVQICDDIPVDENDQRVDEVIIPN